MTLNQFLILRRIGLLKDKHMTLNYFLILRRVGLFETHEFIFAVKFPHLMTKLELFKRIKC